MIRNLTKGAVLADRVEMANTFFGRLKGLLGRSELRKGDALVIEPCSSIHTVGMKFSIDVLFLDKRSRVVGLRKCVDPFRFTRVFWRARQAIELPASSIDDTNTGMGDIIDIDAGLSED